MKSFSARGGAPRNRKTALVAFRLVIVTLLCLVLLHFAVVTDHGPRWWSQITR